MQDVTYTTVVFKTRQHRPPQATEEETVYEEVRPDSERTQQSAETNAGGFQDKKAASRGRQYQRFVCCLGIVCVGLLSGIIALSVHNATLHHENDATLESVMKHFGQNQTSLLEVIDNQKNLIDNLNSTIVNLRWDHSNLTKEYKELKTSYMNVTAENQQLKTKKSILEESIENMTRDWNNLNISRAQWTVNSYCSNTYSRRRCCTECEKGWSHFSRSCYYTEKSKLKTWEEAREECRRKNADLVVLPSQEEWEYIYNNVWLRYDYWIGLRFEAGSWKWINGPKQSYNYWMEQPSDDARCAISVATYWTQRWRAVRCNDKKHWICKKKALSLKV